MFVFIIMVFNKLNVLHDNFAKIVRLYQEIFQFYAGYNIIIILNNIIVKE